jgi:hypothetical protein
MSPFAIGYQHVVARRQLPPTPHLALDVLLSVQLDREYTTKFVHQLVGLEESEADNTAIGLGRLLDIDKTRQRLSHKQLQATFLLGSHPVPYQRDRRELRTSDTRGSKQPYRSAVGYQHP